MSLIFSISGIRGIVGESLTPDVIVKYSSAFAQFCNHGKVVIGQDGRVTGRIISNLVSSTFLSIGCDVVDLGIVPTPTVALAVEKLVAAGGIAITASHNPIQWNGLKFIAQTGMFLNAEENQKLWNIAEGQKFNYAAWDKIGRHITDESFMQQHIGAVLSLPYINIEQIKNRKFKIVVDCINASGGNIVPKMLRDLGCEVIELNCEVSGIFTRNPEPIPENLVELCKCVKNVKADLGIAVDPDVDRLVLITEKGEPFGEEYTITSVVKFILSKQNSKSQILHPPSAGKHPKSQNVVVNLSTTRAIDVIAKSYGTEVIRTPVGEINVAQKMKEVGAIVGGEGSGGVILPDVHFTRDAIVGIGLILQQLAEYQGTISEFKESLPKYSIVKSKFESTSGGHRKDIDRAFETIQRKYESAGIINTEDGLKIDFEDSWVHLRKSNTEPIIRIIAEAQTMDRAKQLVEQFKKHF
ncbi:MAG: phosphoglucosamine mutase [Bacteroidota bacterium]|nr:phosphoglucosamine mutase [Bacteroidota bacterium]